MFNGRVPGIYDSWLDASRQVHKFPNANHKSYKDRREAEAAYMEYLHGNGMGVHLVRLHRGKLQTYQPQLHLALL